MARVDEFHDRVEEFAVLVVDVVDAQAPMGQEVGQVVESPGVSCIFDPGRLVAGFSAAEDALAADLVRVRVEAGALDGVLAREKLQRVLEGTLCSMTLIAIGRATFRFAWRGEGEVSDVRARLKALKKQLFILVYEMARGIPVRNAKRSRSGDIASRRTRRGDMSALSKAPRRARVRGGHRLRAVRRGGRPTA
jgi:hypothetical protein